jgi:hypothetical protein
MAVQVPDAQRYKVVLAVPSVLNHADPLPVGAVPQVVVGAPGPIPILALLTLVPIPYGATAAVTYPGVNGIAGSKVNEPTQNAPVAPSGVSAETDKNEFPEELGTQSKVYRVQVEVNAPDALLRQ